MSPLCAPQSLDLVADGLWCLNAHFVTCGCKGSLRMTVVRTPEGLVIYSPVALTPDQTAAIKALGPVTAIIAPNLFHHFYLRACIEAFPEATVYVPQGLPEKIGAIPGAVILPWESSTDFGGVLEAATIAGHTLRETVLYHRPTRTLITADLIYNYQAEHFPAEKAFFRLIGCYGRPSVAAYHRLAIRDQNALRAFLNRVGAWSIARIIMSHGRIIEDGNAGQIFARAWARIVKP